MSEAAAELRIVSLLPSATEIVCALGLEGRLVGRSHECDHPPAIGERPVCTSASLRDGTSREIDDQVKRLVHDGLSIYDVDTALLRELNPTHVVTQDQCEVCAASLGDLERALAEWTGGRPEIVSLSPMSLGDVWRDILSAARALGVAEAGEALVGELTDRVTELGERVGTRLAGRARPRVACIEWLDPLMVAGNWVPELVALAGGESLFGAVGEHSPWTEWTEIRDADPDVLVLMPCGFDLERTELEAKVLRELPGFTELRAVRDGRCAAVDANAYFNRPGPRLVDSAEILAEILHDVGDAHRAAWRPFGGR